MAIVAQLLFKNVSLKLRDAVSSDLAMLSTIKPTEALHRHRIQYADNAYVRYIISELDNYIIGFGLLVFKTPETWTKMKFLPTIVDLYISPEYRSQGIGTFVIHEMEKIAFNQGYNEIFMGVNPKFNQLAYSLYLRLGYKPLEEEPYLNHWSFTTSDGEIHEGHNWHIDLRKELDSVNH